MVKNWLSIFDIQLSQNTVNTFSNQGETVDYYSQRFKKRMRRIKDKKAVNVTNILKDCSPVDPRYFAKKDVSTGSFYYWPYLIILFSFSLQLCSSQFPNQAGRCWFLLALLWQRCKSCCALSIFTPLWNLSSRRERRASTICKIIFSW